MKFDRRLGNSDNEASAKSHSTLKLYSLKTPHTTRNRPLLITYNTKYKANNVWNVSHYSDIHDDVIKWKHFPGYRPFVRGIHRSSVTSPHKGQWCGALMFTLICPDKRLSKQSWGWWFETLSHSLWRHRNESGIAMSINTATRLDRWSGWPPLVHRPHMWSPWRPQVQPVAKAVIPATTPPRRPSFGEM